MREFIGVLDALRQRLGIPGFEDILPSLTRAADASAQPVPPATGPVPIFQPVRIGTPSPTNDLFRQAGQGLFELTPAESGFLSGINPFSGGIGQGDTRIRDQIQPFVSQGFTAPLTPTLTPQDFGSPGLPQPTLGGQGREQTINQYIYRTDVDPEQVRRSQTTQSLTRQNGLP